jgi:hypothetical protein
MRDREALKEKRAREARAIQSRTGWPYQRCRFYVWKAGYRVVSEMIESAASGGQALEAVREELERRVR